MKKRPYRPTQRTRSCSTVCFLEESNRTFLPPEQAEEGSSFNCPTETIDVDGGQAEVGLLSM